jgi:hypothetical protein
MDRKISGEHTSDAIEILDPDKVVGIIAVLGGQLIAAVLRDPLITTPLGSSQEREQIVTRYWDLFRDFNAGKPIEINLSELPRLLEAVEETDYVLSQIAAALRKVLPNAPVVRVHKV